MPGGIINSLDERHHYQSAKLEKNAKITRKGTPCNTRSRVQTGAQQHCTVSSAKMAAPIDLPFGLWTRVGPINSVVFAGWCQCALMGGHTGATWRIRLTHLSAAVMQPCVKLL